MPEGCFFASHLVATPDGVVQVYRKTHIAPPEKQIFSSGQTAPLFEINGVRFGIQLCYDAHFPELSTRMAVNGADLIFFPHASPRGTPEGKLQSWMRHLSARAFDNGLFVAAVNQTGDNGLGLSFPGMAVVIGPGRGGALPGCQRKRSDFVCGFKIGSAGPCAPASHAVFSAEPAA